MFWNGKLWSLTNTKSCFFTFAIFTLLVYSILLNNCFVRRVHGVLSAVDTYSSLNKTVGRNVSVPYDSHVRLIPLITWVDLKKISEKEVENTKYRLLGNSDLRPARKLPDALVIGVKKSGTRALLEFLRLHPDVRAAGSEVHFFDKFYHKGFNWYRRKMPPTLEGQVTMEKTPSYFVTREAPQRVKQMNPKTKLLVVVRDPVTRAISDYTQAASKKENRSYMQKFECLAFVKGTGFSVVDTSWAPVRIGVYARHLSKWLKYFPIEQLLFVSGERLISDPAAEMARVQVQVLTDHYWHRRCVMILRVTSDLLKQETMIKYYSGEIASLRRVDFLGLKRVVTEKHFYFNATKGFPCLLKSEGRPAPHCLGKTKGRNHPYINPKAIERLREFYKPFNLRFYQMTGINFGWV